MPSVFYHKPRGAAIKVILNNWLLKYLPRSSLIRSQQQMVWSSIPFALICLWYLNDNTTIITEYPPLIIGVCLAYFAIQFFAAKNIKTRTDSAWKIYSLIVLNSAIVLIIMAISHGITSSIFLLFFFILMSTAYWFGLSTLILTLAFILTGYIFIAAISGIPSVSLFITHIFTLSIGPVVGYLLSKQAETTHIYKESTRNKFISILNQIPLPLFTYQSINNQLRIRITNKEMHRLYLKTTDELYGQDIKSIAIPEDESVISQHCDDTLKEKNNKSSTTFYLRSQNSHGEILRLMIIAAHIRWQGESIGVCFLIDITGLQNRHRDMQAGMRTAYMSTLISGIVHDFRNVLTSVIGSAEVLKFSVDDEILQNQLDRIIDSGEQGSDTITHLLKVGGTYNAPKQQDTINIKNTLEAIIANTRIMLPNHIKLTCHIEEDLPDVYFTAIQLEQTLQSIIENACYAIKDEGSITIFASRIHLDDDNNTQNIKISIVDDGCGIHERDLPLVTQSFWSSRKNKGGVGLGLTMAKRIVNKHHGKLDINSIFGVGTTVDILLTDEKQKGQENKQKSKQAIIRNRQDSEQLTSKSCCILLVDDSPEVLDVHQMLLEEMGHTVLTAVSGIEAVSIFNTHDSRIQMLITDLKMPKMDGIELARIIDEKSPQFPLIMITAHEQVTLFEQTKGLNVTLLLKPGTYQKLSETIAKVQTENPSMFS